MIRHVKLLISGRVQGVFFRASTHSQALKLNVVGTVKNLADGCVEVYAQAEHDNLQSFITWCHKGPIAARVDQVELSELPINPQLISFEVVDK
ncbi:MAG: acylphosphatase [Methylococcaceae bacterium]|jgi:acylphosphatase